MVGVDQISNIMASPNTLKIRNSQPQRRETYLGEYNLAVDDSTGKIVNQMCRSGWNPGRQFKSRDGVTSYTVGSAGNLIRNN